MIESYFKPTTSLKVKLFLRNEEGQPKKFPKQYGLKLENNGYALVIKSRHDHSCREVIIRSLAEALSISIFDPYNGNDFTLDGCLSFSSPKTKRGKALIRNTAEISYKLAHQGAKYGSRMKLLRSKSSEQRRALKLMEALVSGTAVLLGGPAALSSERNRVKGSGVFGSRQMSIAYCGLSNFIIKHPAITSLLVGMGRFALELWADEKFEEVDEAIGVDDVIDRLGEKKEAGVVSAADKKFILSRLKKLKPFFTTDKISFNPGFYPLNKHNWIAFVRFINARVDKMNLAKAWSRGDLYGSVGGFHEWCEENVKTKSLKEAFENNSWDGGEYEYDPHQDEVDESYPSTYSW